MLTYSALDTDHIDGSFTALVDRARNLRNYISDHDVLLRLHTSGVPSQDAWFALAAARVEDILGDARAHADRVANPAGAAVRVTAE